MRLIGQQKIVTNVYHILNRISALHKTECQKIKAKISGAKESDLNIVFLTFTFQRSL